MVAFGWEKSSMIEEARGILEIMECLSIHHNYKEANVVADRLTNDVMGLKDRKVWDSKFP